jgi:hypothetical protein
MHLRQCRNARVLISQEMTNYHFGYWNEYPLASFPDMNRVLYSSK